MLSTSTTALIKHGFNGDTILEDSDRVVGAHYPKPATHMNPGGFGIDSELYLENLLLAGDDQSVHLLGSIAASADANANTLNTGDGDAITQSGASDQFGGSSDGTDPETEALEKVMGRYVPRTKPSKPAIGAKASSLPSARSKPANNVSSQPSGTKSGRPAAVTATANTTAPRPKK